MYIIIVAVVCGIDIYSSLSNVTVRLYIIIVAVVCDINIDNSLYNVTVGPRFINVCSCSSY